MACLSFREMIGQQQVHGEEEYSCCHGQVAVVILLDNNDRGDHNAKESKGSEQVALQGDCPLGLYDVVALVVFEKYRNKNKGYEAEYEEEESPAARVDGEEGEPGADVFTLGQHHDILGHVESLERGVDAHQGVGQADDSSQEDKCPTPGLGICSSIFKRITRFLVSERAIRL